MIEITIKGELNENTVFVLTVQERHNVGAKAELGICEIDELAYLVSKRLFLNPNGEIQTVPISQSSE